MKVEVIGNLIHEGKVVGDGGILDLDKPQVDALTAKGLVCKPGSRPKPEPETADVAEEGDGEGGGGDPAQS